ncbi:ATP-binding protein [Vibrio profundum]|uniref:ATP-binding protein n=1 Tax=Vibrio profundum TaxID=2910247 RepID=UPI003D0DA595
MWTSITTGVKKLFSPKGESAFSESVLRQCLIDSSQDGIVLCVVKKDVATIQYCNQAMYDLLHLQSDEDHIQGKELYPFYQKYFSEKNFESIKQVTELNRSACVDMPLTHDPKPLRWLGIQIEPILNLEGHTTHLMLTHKDLTHVKQTFSELNQTHDQLQQSLSLQASQIAEYESHIQAMFEDALDTMLLIDCNQTIINANSPSTELFGYDIDTLCSTNLNDLVNNLDINLLKTDAGSSNKEVELTGLVGIKSNRENIPLVGYVRKVQINAQPFIVLILRDLSTYKMTEKELQRSQIELQETVTRLNLATNSGGIGIWNWDFLTDQVDWDERMYEIYDVAPGLVEENYDMWKNCVVPEDVDQVEQSLQDARENLTQFNAEFRIQLPFGEVRWIRAAADIVFDADSDTPIGMGGVNIDITKEKNAQEFLRHESEIAQAASEAKSMFLANMSHEIRTPMNGVVGMLSLLDESELSLDQHSMVKTIKDSALTLLHIINDILDFSKIEAGQMSLENVPVELPMVIERTLDVLGLQAEKKGIELYSAYGADLPKVITSDSVRLSQILLNLVGNAVKFTDNQNGDRGRVSIHANLKAGNEGNQIEIVVEDNGIGMTDEQMLKLFNAFTQADTSTTRLFGGTGLGLSITKTLLELMGGDIGVQSEYGVGSAFTINIPLIEVENQPHDSDPEDLQENKLLFITSDKSLISACKATLKGYECEATFVSSFLRAQSVLEYAEMNYQPYNVILLGPDFSLAQCQSEFKKLDELSSEYHKVNMVRGLTAESPSGDKRIHRLPCNPYKPSLLIQAIAVVTGRRSLEQLEYHENQPLDTNNQTGIKSGLILVVDDQPTNRDVMKRQLNYWGYDCEMAIHGQDALKLWQSKQFDLILTDCHMPVMDGYELAHNIRSQEHQEPQLGHIPIIAVTANALADAADQCLSSGMDDYLAKPVELKKLGSCVNKWLTIAPRPNQADLSDKESPNAPSENSNNVEEVKEVQGSPICMQTLSDMIGTTDDEIVVPLLEGYWESVQSDVDEITQALDELNEQRLQQLAHAAKGAARSAGANIIALTFEELQNTALEKDWPYLEKRVQDGKQELDRLKVYLQQNSIIK